MDYIPDDALVVRGGRNRPTDIQRGTDRHPSGVTGVSVECGVAMGVEQLAAALPHGQVGITKAKAVRDAGGDVTRTSGRTPFHATVTGLSAEALSRLLTPTQPHPRRRAGELS